MTHFEILSKRTGNLIWSRAFPTYDDALTLLTEDPLISANANHPFFWGTHFEIVLCGGCSLTQPSNSASL